jgi:hypothetical protein
VLLWIASLTLVLCGAAALVLVGSRGAALSFGIVALVLAPPGQEAIARWRHNMAPAKAALFSSITLVPVGLGLLVIDGVAALDREASKRGFASAGQWARAKDLNLATPAALAAYDETQRRAAIAKSCVERGARRPIECYEAGHQKAARAFIAARLGAGELEAVVRDALVQQRKAFLAADKACQDLLDRIDEDALPRIIQEKPALLGVAAAAWARHFSTAELEQLVARSKPGGTYLTTGDSRVLEQKLAALAPAIEKELDLVLQTWARMIVEGEPSWRSFLRGRLPLTACKHVQEPGK